MSEYCSLLLSIDVLIALLSHRSSELSTPMSGLSKSVEAPLMQQSRSKHFPVRWDFVYV